jgi:hypothetical protein
MVNYTGMVQEHPKRDTLILGHQTKAPVKFSFGKFDRSELWSEQFDLFSVIQRQFPLLHHLHTGYTGY